MFVDDVKSFLPARLVDVGLDSNVNSGDGQVAAVVVLDAVKGANESIVRLGLSCSGAGAGSGKVRRHNRDIPSGSNQNGAIVLLALAKKSEFAFPVGV